MKWIKQMLCRHDWEFIPKIKPTDYEYLYVQWLNFYNYKDVLKGARRLGYKLRCTQCEKVKR